MRSRLPFKKESYIYEKIEVGMDDLYVTFEEIGMQAHTIIKDKTGLSVVSYVVHEAGYEDISSDAESGRRFGASNARLLKSLKFWRN